MRRIDTKRGNLERYIACDRATLFCPDTATVWPSYWPFNDPAADPNMGYVKSCFTSTTAP